MDDDRLAWIYSATGSEELRVRYQQWAQEYDADLESMQWLAPRACAERCRHFAGPRAVVLDAGCGTGLVGLHLRELGVGRLVGLDLSSAMLEQAARRAVYDELHAGSLLDPLPYARGSFDAVVSVGVFTFGHVGPEGLAGLADVVRPGGHVTMTFRDDVVEELGYGAEARRLAAIGVWRPVDCTLPVPLIVEEGVGADMRVWTWQVLD